MSFSEIVHKLVSKSPQQGLKTGNRAKGFTLIELVIVISVIAVAAAVAVPSYKEMMDRNKTVRLASEINGFLMQAKSEAVMRNEKVEIKFIRDGGASAATAYDDGEWVLALLPPGSPVSTRSDALDQAYSVINGEGFKTTKLEVDKVSTDIDPVRAVFSDSMNFKTFVIDTKFVKVNAHEKVGRISTCSEDGVFGYDEC